MTDSISTRSTHPTLPGLRSTFLGILANTLLAATKGIAGVLGNSYALIADAIESATDIASSIIVWGGLRISALPPDDDHPFGHGKAEPLAGVVVSLTLMAAAVGIAIQSIREIETPHHAPAPFTLIVLAVVIITKETLFRFVFRVGDRINSIAVKGDAWHHRSDAFTSMAAFVGISVSWVGGAGYESADDWAALFASAVILFNALRILRPAINEVMDAAPPASIENSVRGVGLKVEGVLAVEKCFVRKIGFSHYVDIHITVDGSLSVRRGHDIARDVRKSICSSNPGITDVLVHVEPSDLINEGSPPRNPPSSDDAL